MSTAAVVLATGEGDAPSPPHRFPPQGALSGRERALVDLALDRVPPLTPRVAVNVRYARALLEEHLAGRSVKGGAVKVGG